MDGLALALALLRARDLGIGEMLSALPDAPVVVARPRPHRLRRLVRRWRGAVTADALPTLPASLRTDGWPILSRW